MIKVQVLVLPLFYLAAESPFSLNRPVYDLILVLVIDLYNLIIVAVNFYYLKAKPASKSSVDEFDSPARKVIKIGYRMNI